MLRLNDSDWQLVQSLILGVEIGFLLKGITDGKKLDRPAFNDNSLTTNLTIPASAQIFPARQFDYQFSFSFGNNNQDVNIVGVVKASWYEREFT